RDSVLFASPKNDEERKEIASTCVLNLAIQIPVLVDGIDNTTERAYTAWPERMYLIGKGGLVIFKSRPGPFGFRIEELAKALRLEAERDEKVPTYGSLVLRVQDAIHRHVPDMATVMVISKGDDALLQLNGRRAWHFPQDSNGHYAGHYPGDTSEVISDLQG